ncbi:hypothetical protein WA1_42785 [Scytonema hofmannii PCC 7110]|uniref:Ribbon-helix-helix protein CopG domain-containing protein n=1 Tax=Scytonema hofmannii PCC 7110 TaxID=128403 RepID=A0A139WVH1_9CYAN|nr:ribbon-helix-helix protein, CopG family [Scytonema hofmannii]KYC36436.1 hypothetical protein WA1_42785 [Scytonema hofmannii PCC 7110]
MSTGKGKKRIKNQPVLYSSLKKQKGLWLTTEIWELVEQQAALNGLSRSEYIEQLIRKYHAR